MSISPQKTEFLFLFMFNLFSVPDMALKCVKLLLEFCRYRNMTGLCQMIYNVV